MAQELKAFGIRGEENGRLYFAEVYTKRDVDALLAEKDAEITELKAKNKRLEELKDKYSSCDEKAINTIAKCELKIRMLSRALYKACANWAHGKDGRYYLKYVCISDDARIQYERWRRMERKCRAKEEEYK